MKIPESIQPVNIAERELRLVKLFIVQKTFLMQYILYFRFYKSSGTDKMM